MNVSPSGLGTSTLSLNSEPQLNLTSLLIAFTPSPYARTNAVNLPTTSETDYLRAQASALRQSLRLGKVRQEKFALLLQHRAGEWKNERTSLKQKLDWCESLVNNERQRAVFSAEEAAEAQHQLSLLQVERRRLEEQLECAGRAYSQLVHRVQVPDRPAKLLDKDTHNPEEVTNLKETVQRLKAEVRELEATKSQKRELESHCRKRRAEVIRARDNLEVAELTRNRANLLEQQLEEAKDTIAGLRRQLRELSALLFKKSSTSVLKEPASSEGISVPSSPVSSRRTRPAPASNI